jgi:hypothetical protein
MRQGSQDGMYHVYVLSCSRLNKDWEAEVGADRVEGSGSWNGGEKEGDREEVEMQLATN